MWHRASTPGVGLKGDDPALAGLAFATEAGTSTAIPTELSFTKPPTAHRDLHDAVLAFRGAHPVGVYSAKRMLDPLLDLWALAAAVDRAVARPIEAVLVTLVDRTVVTARELSACADQVEASLARLSA